MSLLASHQHGVVDLDELRALGLSRFTVRDWVRAGRLFRLHLGVYSVVPPRMLTVEARWRAAVKACGPGAVLSHGAAAQLLGLIDRREHLALHVSVLDRRRIRRPGIVVHRPVDLEPRDVTRRLGIPTTTATRTIFDQASCVTTRELRAQFEQAEHLEVLIRGRLDQLLDGATGRRGLGELRQLTGYSPIPLGRTKSKLERIVLSLCRSHSLPMPAVNVPLLDFEVDFVWLEAGFVIEADGGQHQGEQRDRDNERDLALQRAGFLVRRYSGAALRDEDAVAREILAILRERLPSGPAS